MLKFLTSIFIRLSYKDFFVDVLFTNCWFDTASAMGSVWKRLQRVNKRAAKFQFTVSYNELHVETTSKWYSM